MDKDRYTPSEKRLSSLKICECSRLHMIFYSVHNLCPRYIPHQLSSNGPSFCAVERISANCSSYKDVYKEVCNLKSPAKRFCDGSQMMVDALCRRQPSGYLDLLSSSHPLTSLSLSFFLHAYLFVEIDYIYLMSSTVSISCDICKCVKEDARATSSNNTDIASLTLFVLKMPMDGWFLTSSSHRRASAKRGYPMKRNQIGRCGLGKTPGCHGL